MLHLQPHLRDKAQLVVVFQYWAVKVERKIRKEIIGKKLTGFRMNKDLIEFEFEDNTSLSIYFDHKIYLTVESLKKKTR
jgi:hypothetical protein